MRRRERADGKGLKAPSPTVNPESEKVAHPRSMWFDSWKAGRRCIIPMSAFYEWTGPPGRKVTHRFQGKNIAQVLELTVDAAADFFVDEPTVTRSLEILQGVGLGYLRLGQPATELSGGEAQRIKLATELQRRPKGHTLYVLDEPTTG